MLLLIRLDGIWGFKVAGAGLRTLGEATNEVRLIIGVTVTDWSRCVEAEYNI